MIVDCHVHFTSMDLHDEMIADMDRTGVDQFCALVVPICPGSTGPSWLPDALWLKAKYPRRVFVFGGLDYSSLPEGDDEAARSLVAQLDRLIAIGCDGLKLLCGKPTARKAIGRPLDGPFYEPLLRRLEETSLPVLWHVADPAEFWSEHTVPLWARQNRWWYDDTVPPKEQLDREIAAVLEKHQGLNLILAHFFFMSHDLPAAGKLLDRYPNIHFDLTPGVEMFHNFTKDPEAAREFFIRYAGRILYGTDTGMGGHNTGPKRGWMVRHWLESDESFDVPDDPYMTPDARPPLRGVALPADALEQIYAGNFHRIVGAAEPKPLDRQATISLLGELARVAAPGAAERVLGEFNSGAI